jgi:hypothetical protein
LETRDEHYAIDESTQVNSPGNDFELVQKEVPKSKENEVLNHSNT